MIGASFSLALPACRLHKERQHLALGVSELAFLLYLLDGVFDSGVDLKYFLIRKFFGLLILRGLREEWQVTPLPIDDNLLRYVIDVGLSAAQ